MRVTGGNPEKGEVRVEVEGQEYTLRPTFDALCELEERCGCSIFAVLETIKEGRLSGLRSVVFAFMQDCHGDEFKALRDASMWIEKAGGSDKVIPVLYHALGINVPDDGPAKGTDADPRTAQAGTGDGSSQPHVDTV